MAAEKYDDVLLPFLSLMRKELHANSRKGDRSGWLAMDANTLLLEVYWHTAKLSAAVKNNDGPAIMEHSADVANMAMMVLDICGGIGLIEALGVLVAAPTDTDRLEWLTRHISGKALRDAGVTWPAWSLENAREAIDRARNAGVLASRHQGPGAKGTDDE